MSWSYAGLLRHIGRHHPAHGIQAEGAGGVADLPGTIEEMAERYLRLLRTVRPSGPYHLVGWSFGGLVAHAMAVRLRELGEPEGTLFLVDAVAATGAGPAEPICCAPTAPRATRAPPPTSRPPANPGARHPRTNCGGRTPAAS
ncbi:thioesterase domain-containing protein [Streptomyces asiaticus]|uniref:thioesterase domain-containing protein n=1 Tax=Streptomyces asiaticus TaxID=114695 RepID=UPI003815B0FD